MSNPLHTPSIRPTPPSTKWPPRPTHRPRSPDLTIPRTTDPGRVARTRPRQQSPRGPATVGSPARRESPHEPSRRPVRRRSRAPGTAACRSGFAGAPRSSVQGRGSHVRQPDPVPSARACRSVTQFTGQHRTNPRINPASPMHKPPPQHRLNREPSLLRNPPRTEIPHLSPPLDQPKPKLIEPPPTKFPQSPSGHSPPPSHRIHPVPDLPRPVPIQPEPDPPKPHPVLRDDDELSPLPPPPGPDSHLPHEILGVLQPIRRRNLHKLLHRRIKRHRINPGHIPRHERPQRKPAGHNRRLRHPARLNPPLSHLRPSPHACATATTSSRRPQHLAMRPQASRPRADTYSRSLTPPQPAKSLSRSNPARARP